MTIQTRTVNGANYGPVTAISPGGSPFTWQNPESVPVLVVISVGTVTLLEYSIDNSTWLTLGLIAGAFKLNPGQWIKVTYVVAPTMNYVPI